MLMQQLKVKKLPSIKHFSPTEYADIYLKFVKGMTHCFLCACPHMHKMILVQLS